MEYPPEELKFIHNQIEERAYVIEQNLTKTGAGEDYSLLDIGCGEGFYSRFYWRVGNYKKSIGWMLLIRQDISTEKDCGDFPYVRGYGGEIVGVLR